MFVRSLPSALARLLVSCLILSSGACEPFTSAPIDPTSASQVFLIAVSPNRGSTGGGASVVVTGADSR